jgi:hypothetical protein
MSDVLAGFKITATRIDNNHTNDDMANMDAWRITVTNPRGERFQRQFFMGYGHRGKAPELLDFMECMISDAECVEYDSLEGFMENMGYDTDSISATAKAKRVYRACERIGKRLEVFLTPEEREAFTVAARGE